MSLSDEGEVEAFAREANEEIIDLGETFGASSLQLVLCECDDPACVEEIEVSQAEYDDVRSVPTRFLLLPGHVDSKVERVVKRTPTYVVVEKFGKAAEVAIQRDPRR